MPSVRNCCVNNENERRGIPFIIASLLTGDVFKDIILKKGQMPNVAIAPIIQLNIFFFIVIQVFNVDHGLVIFLQEDLSEHVVQGDAHPGHVGTACLLSSSFLESGKDIGLVTLPIMGRNSRQTIGKVKGETASCSCVSLSPKVCCTYARSCLLSSFQWTTWWSGPSRGCSATWARPSPNTGRREAPWMWVTEEPAAPMQPSESTNRIKTTAGASSSHNNNFCNGLFLQASQDQGEHNSLIQKCCEACKLLKGLKMLIQFVCFFPLNKHLQPLSPQDVWRNFICSTFP